MERITQAIDKAKAAEGTAELARPRQGVPVRTALDVEQDLSQIAYHETRVVALDPDHLERHRIVALDEHDHRAGVFDMLRTQIMRPLREHRWNSLAVVSPTPECGKTMVAINLAMSLAHQPAQTVLLADFDLRRPRMAAYLGLPGGPGLLDHLNGGVPLPDVLVNPGLPRLVVLPNTRSVSKATELLTSARVRSLVAELKQRYESRLVLFDLPPLLTTDDAIAFLPQVDCVLLVAAQGVSTQSDVVESLRLLKPFNVVGTILNKADVRRPGYYYGTPKGQG